MLPVPVMEAEARDWLLPLNVREISEISKPVTGSLKLTLSVEIVLLVGVVIDCRVTVGGFTT